MRLSEVNLFPNWNPILKRYENENLTNEQIEQIVFSEIEDDKKPGTIAIVFGTSRKIEAEARVKKSCELYHEKRIQKIFFTGGYNGISNVKNNQTPESIQEENKEISALFQDYDSEASRMKKMAIQLQVPEENIIIDEISNNSNESLKNLIKYLNVQEGENVLLITSEYHLKRCLASALKYVLIPLTYSLVAAPTGYFERDNYQNTTLGETIINFEAFHLIRLAREKKIYDLEIQEDERKKYLSKE